MVTTEERLAHIEGRVAEHRKMFTGLQEAIVHFEQRVDRRFEQVDARFSILEGRLTALDAKVDQRIGALDQKIDALDLKVGGQIASLREEITGHFRWTLGLVFTGFVAIVTALVAR